MLRVLLPLILSMLSIQVFGEGSADQPTGLTLESAFQLAQDGAPIYLAAKYRKEAADAQRSVAKGQLLPQLSLFGDWSDNKLKYEGSQAALYGEQNYPGERYGFQARQSLVNMAGWRELERRDALLNRSENDFLQAKIDLLQSVAEAYLRVLVARDTVLQFESEVEALENQLQESEALYELSLIPVTQLLETQTRFESVTADLLQSEGEAAIAKEQLAEFIGLREFTLLPMGHEVVLTTQPTSMVGAVQLAIANSPAIAAAKDGVSAAKATVEREKGSWWPEINLIYNQQFSDVGFDNLSSPPRTSDSISISVSYPLIQGGSGSARIRGAWADYYGAQQELEGVSRAVETQTRSAWLQLESSEKRVRAAKRALESAEVGVDATKKSVRAGTARVTDVLLALAQRTRAQRDHSYSQLERISAWVALELISGSEVQKTASHLSDALLSHVAVTATSYAP